MSERLANLRRKARDEHTRFAAALACYCTDDPARPGTHAWGDGGGHGTHDIAHSLLRLRCGKPFKLGWAMHPSLQAGLFPGLLAVTWRLPNGASWRIEWQRLGDVASEQRAGRVKNPGRDATYRACGPAADRAPAGRLDRSGPNPPAGSFPADESPLLGEATREPSREHLPLDCGLDAGSVVPWPRARRKLTADAIHRKIDVRGGER